MSPVPTAEQLNELVTALRGGTITPDAFFRGVDRKLRYVAQDVWRGWRRKLPCWVQQDDVLQVLRMQVLEYVPRWRPDRGSRMWDYVIWSAVHRTQRQIHKWRGAQIHGNEGKNLSRAELSFSKVFRNDPGYQAGESARLEAFMARASDAPEQDEVEERLDRAAKFDEVLQKARTVREALVLHALRACDGSIRMAAEAIWLDYSARVECGLRSEQDAPKVVREAIEAIARRCVVEVPCDLWDALDEDESLTAA